MANEPQESAAKDQDQAQPPAKAAAQQPAAPAAPKYTRDEWRERARSVFGVSPHAISGALFEHEPDSQLSEDDVRQALDDFSVREGISS